LAILLAVQEGELSLLNSEALEYEINRIPDETRRNEVFAVLELANERIEITDDVEILAESLENSGLHPMDAVHLALAATARVDFFVTCDDRLLNKGRALSGLGCKLTSILDLFQEVLK
jgi:predicted nucleic acid-binding protein